MGVGHGVLGRTLCLVRDPTPNTVDVEGFESGIFGSSGGREMSYVVSWRVLCVG